MIHDILRLFHDFTRGGDPAFDPRYPADWLLSFALTRLRDILMWLLGYP